MGVPIEGAYQFNNTGLGVLPAYQGSNYNPEDMQPLTQSNVDFAPGQQGPGVVSERAAPVAAPPALPYSPAPGAPRATPNYPTPGGAYPSVLGGPTDFRSNAVSGMQPIDRTAMMAPQLGPLEKMFKTVASIFNGGDSQINPRTAAPNVGGRPNVGSAMGQQGSLGFWGAAFPGSLLGSFAQSSTAPANGRGYISHSTSMPGYASAAHNIVTSRNLA